MKCEITYYYPKVFRKKCLQIYFYCLLNYFSLSNLSFDCWLQFLFYSSFNLQQHFHLLQSLFVFGQSNSQICFEGPFPNVCLTFFIIFFCHFKLISEEVSFFQLILIMRCFLDFDAFIHGFGLDHSFIDFLFSSFLLDR